MIIIPALDLEGNRSTMPSLTCNSLTLLLKFKWKNGELPRFMAEHDRLHAEAKRTGEYTKLVHAFYSFMAPVIEAGYGASWHFVPPDHARQPWEEADRRLHERMARWIDHGPGKRAIELGCGPGQAMRDIAVSSGGQVLGVALDDAEVSRANELIARDALGQPCKAVTGDMLALPFEDASFDSGYAIDALMYVTTRLDRALAEARRVLKPGAFFLVYGFVRTELPDTEGIVERLHYSQALPPLFTAAKLVDEATRAGFELVTHMDLDRASRFRWFYYLKGHDPVFWWMVNSWFFQAPMGLHEKLGLLPEGFTKFNRVFLAGAIKNLVAVGEKNLMTGSNVLVFRRAG